MILNVYPFIISIKVKIIEFYQKHYTMPKVYASKVCAICGKSEKNHWGRHWKNNHPGAAIV
jgi:hypothetical protein